MSIIPLFLLLVVKSTRRTISGAPREVGKGGRGFIFFNKEESAKNFGLPLWRRKGPLWLWSAPPPPHSLFKQEPVYRRFSMPTPVWNIYGLIVCFFQQNNRTNLGHHRALTRDQKETCSLHLPLSTTRTITKDRTAKTLGRNHQNYLIKGTKKLLRDRTCKVKVKLHLIRKFKTNTHHTNNNNFNSRYTLNQFNHPLRFHPFHLPHRNLSNRRGLDTSGVHLRTCHHRHLINCHGNQIFRLTYLHLNRYGNRTCLHGNLTRSLPLGWPVLFLVPTRPGREILQVQVPHSQKGTRYRTVYVVQRNLQIIQMQRMNWIRVKSKQCPQHKN